MTAHTTGQLHSQSWDLPLVQFQTENSSFPTTSVQLLKSIFNISSTKLKLWFCLIAWTWSKTDPILPVVFLVLFSWRKCHSDITKQNKKQLMKQQTKCSQGFIWYRSSFHSASRNEHSGKEENQSEWQMAQAQALQLLCSQGGSSGNSPEQKESRCQIQQLLTRSKEVREMVPGSLFSPWHSCPYSLFLQHCLECEPQPKDSSFRSVHFLMASKSPRESAQPGFDRNRGFLREGKELPYVEEKPLRVQLCCSAQLHSELLRALGSSRDSPKGSNLMSRFLLKILRNLHKSQPLWLTGRSALLKKPQPFVNDTDEPTLHWGNENDSRQVINTKLYVAFQ